MELAAIAVGATAVAASVLQHFARPRAAAYIDPYTVWMIRNLPSGRAWHR